MLLKKNRILYSLLILLSMLFVSIQPLNVRAQERTIPETSTAERVTVDKVEDGVAIQWQLSPNDETVSAASALNSLSTLRYAGYDLPVQFLRFQTDGSADVPQLIIQQIEASTWGSEPAPARELIPPAVDWLPSDQPLGTAVERSLPSEPVFIHSTGRLRGREIHVVAISPIFQEDGVVKLARRIEARMIGVNPVEGNLSDLLLADNLQASAVDRPYFADLSQLIPTNPAAAVNSVKLIVEKGGIQSVSGADLSGKGLNLADVGNLALTYRGQPVPIEILGGNSNGVLDDNEIIRFYAPGIGDYWNREEVYWLSIDGSKVARMASRDATPGSAPLLTTAFEHGIWRNNKMYDPKYGGHDEDHWFATRMTVSPDLQGKPDEYPSLTAQFARVLPSASGQSIVTPNLTLIQPAAEYELDMIAGNSTKTATRPSEAAASPDNFWSPEFDFTDQFSAVEIVLIPADDLRVGALLVDSIEWKQPVSLSFGGKGAVFLGETGTYRYRLSGLADDAAVYDITDPMYPLRLTGIANGTFQSGPQTRTYLVTGNGTVHKPRIEAHDPVVFSSSNGADALYIAPSLFIDDLSPLVAHRQSQGYQVKVIDVQDIYDAWSYGHVAPEAIRAFLRFAVQEWNPSPISAVLVSDGTRDPFNYEAKESNINFIPPYLITSFVIDQDGNEEPLDPYLGQNGCENCFGQLDGADPLSNDVETPGAGFMPDIWIGRFPAKNSADVRAIVSKIIRYETDTTKAKRWRSQALFLADNFYLYDYDPAKGEDPILDNAGNFVEYSEQIIDLLPSGIHAARLYYDPTASSDDPWREPNSVFMRQQAVDLMGQGYGLVTFTGHSAHWLWARTSDCAVPLKAGEACPAGQANPDPYIFGLYDTDRLQNRDQPYIGLSMTCYTSQFFEPANSGTVLDERSVVNPNGGAAAVWGPAGLSVATGHDDLQYGFHKLLWDLTEKEPGSARLGQLIEAGYVENMAPSCNERSSGNAEQCYSCCDDVRRTFLLLGDPLTPVLMVPDNDVYLPLINR